MLCKEETLTVVVEYLPITRALTIFIHAICFVWYSYLIIKYKFLHEKKVLVDSQIYKKTVQMHYYVWESITNMFIAFLFHSYE